MQLSFVEQLGIIPLSEHLIGGDSDGIGKIQASCLVYHRDPERAFGVLHQKLLGQALGFLSEKQVGIVGIFNVGMAVGAFG